MMISRMDGVLVPTPPYPKDFDESMYVVFPVSCFYTFSWSSASAKVRKMQAENRKAIQKMEKEIAADEMKEYEMTKGEATEIDSGGETDKNAE